jgi:hypothetical protein
MKVQLMRSGGFGGIRLSAALNTEELSPQEAAQLRRLISESSFFDQQASLKSASSQPDRFQYRISVEEGERKKEIETDEAGMPERLRPLVDYLLGQARKGRGKK